MSAETHVVANQFSKWFVIVPCRRSTRGFGHERRVWAVAHRPQSRTLVIERPIARTVRHRRCVVAAVAYRATRCSSSRHLCTHRDSRGIVRERERM